MEENVLEKTEDKNTKNAGGVHMGGFFISNRSLWFMAGGALGAVAAIGISKLSNKIRPAAVGVTKEGLAFKEWLVANYEKGKEDIEDIVAEAKHAHQKDLEATAESAKKEKDMLRTVEQMVEEILKRRPEKKEE